MLRVVHIGRSGISVHESPSFHSIYTLVSPLIERTFALWSDNLPEANLFAGLQRGVPGSMLLSIYGILLF